MRQLSKLSEIHMLKVSEVAVLYHDKGGTICGDGSGEGAIFGNSVIRCFDRGSRPKSLANLGYDWKKLVQWQ
jgi:hypothetical protein